MNFLKNSKESFNNYLNIRRKNIVFNKTKKNISVVNNTIEVENVDMTLLHDKDKLNQHLLLLIQKNPNANITFTNCTIDYLNISLLKGNTINFKNCTIKDLIVNEKNNTYVNFDNCKFNFYNKKDKQLISIKTSNINLDKCLININGVRNNTIIFGKDSNSTISIRNQEFKNSSNEIFQIYINAKSLTLSKNKSLSNIKMCINNDGGKINQLHLIDSDVNFNDNKILSINMMLIENSTINNIYTNCEAIELTNECTLNNTRIFNCNDIVLSEESILNTNNIDLNVRTLECKENSIINDNSNRFKWLTNIKKIIVYRNFILMYNGKPIYKQEKEYICSDKEEEIINIANNAIGFRR